MQTILLGRAIGEPRRTSAPHVRRASRRRRSAMREPREPVAAEERLVVVLHEAGGVDARPSARQDAGTLGAGLPNRISFMITS